MLAGGFNNLFYALRAANIARVNAQTGGPSGGGFYPAFIMEVNIRNDGHIHLLDDMLERGRALFVRARHPDNIHAGFFSPQYLCHRGINVGGEGVGHGLHRNRCIAANLNIADANLAGLATVDLLIFTVIHSKSLWRNRG